MSKTTFKSPIPNLWEREMENINIFRKMERRGVRVNLDICRQEIAVGEGRMNQLRKELGINPASPKQLKTLLIDEMKLPVLPEHMTPGGQPSFDKNAMKTYEAILENNPEYTSGQWGSVAANVLEYRGWQITLGLCYRKFVENISPDGRLRTDYWIHGTKTGRVSAHDPNLQQVPKLDDKNPKVWQRNIKRAFEADEGYTLVQVDVNQGEMRLATGYAKQPYLMETFQWNKDMWGQMVAELNRPKAQCKTLTYAKMYGAQRNKLRLILGGDDPDQFITDWEEAHDKIVAFSKKVHNVATRRGYIHLWTGRIRHLKNEGPRLAFNSLLQGGLAEIVKSGMIRLNREVDSDECRMLLMVHDSVIFEIKTEYLDQYITLIKQVFSRVEDERHWDIPFDVTEEFWGKDAA